MTGEEAAVLVGRIVLGDMEAMTEVITILTDPPTAAEAFRPGLPLWNLWALWESEAGNVYEFDHLGNFKVKVAGKVISSGQVGTRDWLMGFRPIGGTWAEVEKIGLTRKNQNVVGTADPDMNCDECGLPLSGIIETATTKSGICLTPCCTTLRAERTK